MSDSFVTPCPWNSPGKNTGVGCHSLLQRIFLTQGSNPRLLRFLHGQAYSLPAEPQGNWVVSKKSLPNPKSSMSFIVLFFMPFVEKMIFASLFSFGPLSRAGDCACVGLLLGPLFCFITCLSISPPTLHSSFSLEVG